jgi:hypothetical protein
VNEIIRPGAGILFMKVGTHANENLSDIVKRKSKEIEDTGFAMWGYGGNTCHPSSMVQPFAKSFADRGKPIYLIMEPMQSNHFAEPLAAAEYSPDGISWKKIPDPIHVLGSRYALVIERLRQEEFTLPLHQTQVSVGPSRGRLGSQYIAGRVDKACLEVLDEERLVNDQSKTKRDIGLVAELREPFAVFLRNYR